MASSSTRRFPAMLTRAIDRSPCAPAAGEWRRRGCLSVVAQTAVSEPQRAAHRGRQARVVGRDHERRALFVVQLEEELLHLLARRRIEVARRLVGEDQAGTKRE